MEDRSSPGSIMDRIDLIIRGRVLKSEWESMTIDELFALREQLQEVLAAKLVAKKAMLEGRLQTLNSEVLRGLSLLTKSAIHVRQAHR